jgi:hypothetical protein
MSVLFDIVSDAMPKMQLDPSVLGYYIVSTILHHAIGIGEDAPMHGFATLHIDRQPLLPFKVFSKTLALDF